MKKVFLALLKRAISNENAPIDISSKLTTENFKSLILLAKKHDLAHLVTHSLDKLGSLPNDVELKSKLLKERNVAIFRGEQQSYELDRISTIFSENKILFIPLKGSVIKKYYKASWMRTSCDIDILVKKTDLDVAISILKSKLGYVYLSKGDHDVSLTSPSGVHLELHYSLVDETAKDSEKFIFGNVWQNGIINNDGNLALSDEYFYCYHVSHVAKHLKYGGCGVRAIIDTYILNNVVTFNKEKRLELLQSAELLEVANAVENLANVWFSNANHNDITLALASYVLSGGSYGTFESKVAAQQTRKSSKFSYLMSRVFLPYKQMKLKYPVLEKYAILYPIYIIVRLFSLLNKNKRELALRELNQTTKSSYDKQDEVTKLLNDLKL